MLFSKGKTLVPVSRITAECFALSSSASSRAAIFRRFYKFLRLLKFLLTHKSLIYRKLSGACGEDFALGSYGADGLPGGTGADKDIWLDP